MANKDVIVRGQWDPNATKTFGERLASTLQKTGQSILVDPLVGISNIGNNLTTSTTGLVTRSSYAYAKPYEKFIGPTGQALSNISTDISKTSDLITNSLTNYSDQISKILEPISDFMGSTLATLTGVLKDPLGSNGLGNVATNLLNSISPGYGNKVNGSITNLNLQAITNLPTQLFSGVDHLITAVDNILAIPLSLLAEVYYGYMEIMKSISKLISNLMNGFTKFIMDFLDSIIPIKEILALLSQVQILANQIGGIATTFLGANQITQFSNQIINFSTQIGGVLNNPLDLVFSQLPTEVNSFINTIQTPQQFINEILPPQLSQAFATISSMTGFGFNGNMGYGFQSVLQGLQGGAIRSILSNYAAQYDVLAPLLAGAGNNLPQSYVPTLTKGKYSPGGLQDESLRGNNPQQYPTGP